MKKNKCVKRVPPIFIQDYLYVEDAQYQSHKSEKEPDESLRGVCEIDLDNASCTKIQIT